MESNTPKSRKGISFIAGLVTGLVIAVFVAVLVARSPISFTSRKDKADSASSVASGDGSSDPNQSLYAKTQSGKDDGTTQQDGTTETRSETGTIAPAPVRQPTIAAQKDSSTETQESKNSAKSEEKDNQKYYIQVGAFGSRDAADTRKGDVALIGESANVTEVNSGGSKQYKVRMGPFKKDRVDAIQKKLKQNGIPSTMIHASK